MLFHSPYTKLVQKSYGRMAYNDFLRHSKDEKFASFSSLMSISLEDSYTNKEIEKKFMAFTKDSFAARVAPSLTCAKNLGNMYCGSLYGGLVSLLSNINSQDLV